jgi:hypothetical protein
MPAAVARSAKLAVVTARPSVSRHHPEEERRPANVVVDRPPSQPIVEVNDQFGNAVQGAAVTWTAESGPVAFVVMGRNRWCRTGPPCSPEWNSGGRGASRAPGGTPAVTFSLTVGPPAPYVVIVRTR